MKEDGAGGEREQVYIYIFFFMKLKRMLCRCEETSRKKDEERINGNARPINKKEYERNVTKSFKR